MNSDQIIGNFKIISGKIQECIGRFLGNFKQETKGYALEYEGIRQRKRGYSKQSFEDLVPHKFH